MVISAGVGLFHRLMSEWWNVCRWSGYLLVPVSGWVYGYQLRRRSSSVCLSRVWTTRLVVTCLRMCSQLQRSILSDEWWGLHVKVRHAASLYRGCFSAPGGSVQNQCGSGNMVLTSCVQRFDNEYGKLSSFYLWFRSVLWRCLSGRNDVRSIKPSFC